MTDVLMFLVIAVAVLICAAGISDAREQRRLEDQAARDGSRARHPSYVRKIRRPYDWSKDDR